MDAELKRRLDAIEDNIRKRQVLTLRAPPVKTMETANPINVPNAASREYTIQIKDILQRPATLASFITSVACIVEYQKAYGKIKTWKRARDDTLANVAYNFIDENITAVRFAPVPGGVYPFTIDYLLQAEGIDTAEGVE